MTRTSKYNNIPCHFDLERDCLISKYYKSDFVVTFDSILEYNVYQLIRKVVKADCISIHKPIPIWDATPNHPKFDWCVDFTINLPQGNLYIEAKGISTADFIYRLRALDYVNPELLNRIMFVTQLKRKVVGKGKYSIWSVEPADLPNELFKMIKQLENKQ